jgi:hypothetical protein
MAAAEWIHGGGQSIEGRRPAGMGATARKVSVLWALVGPYHLEDFTSMEARRDSGCLTSPPLDARRRRCRHPYGRVCFAGEMGGDANDVGKSMHPTLCESIKMARGLQGVRTDAYQEEKGQVSS